MPSRTIDGKTIAFTERGSGFPLVLLHGFPLDSRIWDAQAASLSDRWRVISIDLPGFGQSQGAQPFTMSSIAGDVHAMLASLGALPCVLGGLSMGGYVALEYVKKYPTDLRALMLIDTRAEGDSAEGKQNRQKMIDLVRASGAKAVADQMRPKLLAESTLKGNAPVVQQLSQIMEACPAQTIEHALAAMRDRNDHTADLPSVPVPTLILVGDHDAITPPSSAEAMNKAIPRSKMVVIPDAGHMTPMEQPERVTRAMREFLDSLPAQ
jgi:3-oxoadipate enol-lactonase